MFWFALRWLGAVNLTSRWTWSILLHWPKLNGCCGCKWQLGNLSVQFMIYDFPISCSSTYVIGLPPSLPYITLPYLIHLFPINYLIAFHSFFTGSVFYKTRHSTQSPFRCTVALQVESWGGGDTLDDLDERCGHTFRVAQKKGIILINLKIICSFWITRRVLYIYGTGDRLPLVSAVAVPSQEMGSSTKWYVAPEIKLVRPRDWEWATQQIITVDIMMTMMECICRRRRRRTESYLFVICLCTNMRSVLLVFRSLFTRPG